MSTSSLKLGSATLMALGLLLAGASCQKTTTSAPLNTTPPTPEVMIPKIDSQTVTLVAQNNSAEDGKAVFSRTEDGKTKVVILVASAPAAPEQPAHIHTGSCADLGGVVYPLANLAAGVSETTIDVSLDNLWSKLPLALNVHKSATEASTYVSCGDLK